MEEQLPSDQLAKTDVHIIHPSHKKRNIILALLGAVILIGLVLAKDRTPLVSLFQNEPASIVFPPIPTPVKTNTFVLSKDLTTQGETTFFAGQVTDKTSNSLTIQGKGKTIKFSVPDKIYFIEMPMVLTGTVQEYMKKESKTIDFDSLKNGNFVSVTTKLVNKTQVVTGGIIYK